MKLAEQLVHDLKSMYLKIDFRISEMFFCPWMFMASEECLHQ